MLEEPFRDDKLGRVARSVGMYRITAGCMRNPPGRSMRRE